MSKDEKQRLLKPVSFNLRDPDERQLLETIQERGVNFSGLVKKLLFAYLLEQKIYRESTWSAPSTSRPVIQETPLHEDFPQDAPDFGGMPIDWD
ncbi:hypothetical protein [Risungbinella massiliensis]|uniref:hypothetical protein n=1 Tax=Risungbinella massiliensis TaxID=1329796 RepID=UPI0005CC279F|nr:hypothetical protein [Risungbinella massiliensis]